MCDTVVSMNYFVITLFSFFSDEFRCSTPIKDIDNDNNQSNGNISVFDITCNETVIDDAENAEVSDICDAINEINVKEDK